MLYSQSLALFDRAAQVIPGGIYGHMSPALTIPGAFPYYAERAEGCRYWDVDGREYIDFLCAYGPIILGYQHPEVEEAAERQQRLGNCFNHPTRIMVELAEHLVNLVDFASWSVFGKNGSDMTTWCVQVAREKTKRKKIIRTNGAYHGTHAWCTPGHGGIIDEDREHLLEFPWNDLQAFQDLLRTYRDQIACVILGPFHYPAFGDSVLPIENFFQEIETACRHEGIVLILDDVRGGFRMHLGGSHRYLNFTPDLICFCKALGNGHPIAAALGTPELRVAASKVFLTGSYWNSAVPMAASLATLQILERDNGIEVMKSRGESLLKGLEALGQKHGIPIHGSGHPALPFASFANETNFHRQQLFCAIMAESGILLHPHHNWFICTAHTEKEIQITLEAADIALVEVAENFPPT